MQGRSAFCICAGLLALLFGATELMAGTVYVPVATNRTINGIQYQTQVWITNTGEETGRFSTLFIPNIADGTERDNMPEPVEVPLTANGTFFLRTIAPVNQRGILEIDADPDLVVTARLVAILPNGDEQLGATVPVLSAENLSAEGAKAHLLGILRTVDSVANLGIVNLGFEEAQCTLRAFRITGQQIADTAVITLNPLTMVQFDDVLGFVGVNNVSDSRFEASCDRNFYAYATLYDAPTGDTVFVSPSTEATSALQPPGENPECSPGTECYTVPGLIHQPTSSNRVKRVSFNVPEGQYKVVRANMDIRLGNWAPGNSGGLHSLFWLARNVNKDLIGYLNVRGPNRNRFLCRHNFALPQHLKTKFEPSVQLTAGQTYNFDYVYDTAQDFVEFTVKQGNNVIGRYGCGQPNVARVESRPGDVFHIDFGFSGVNPNEPPTLGWQYRNLLLEFYR